jgi:AmmeMemoRadiSam system protein A
MEIDFTDIEKKTLLNIARKSIEHYLRGSPYKLTGAFVSLHTKNGSLRGCIGHITSKDPLARTVIDVAVSSAVHDSRFQPVKLDELDNIEIEISVLSPFKEIDHIEEIKVGVHGIFISQGFFSGLLLPQVATEYHWDRETFLTQTCYKAGLNGNCWKNPQTKIEIFSAIVFNEKELNL